MAKKEKKNHWDFLMESLGRAPKQNSEQDLDGGDAVEGPPAAPEPEVETLRFVVQESVEEVPAAEAEDVFSSLDWGKPAKEFSGFKKSEEQGTVVSASASAVSETPAPKAKSVPAAEVKTENAVFGAGLQDTTPEEELELSPPDSPEAFWLTEAAEAEAENEKAAEAEPAAGLIGKMPPRKRSRSGFGAGLLEEAAVEAESEVAEESPVAPEIAAAMDFEPEIAEEASPVQAEVDALDSWGMLAKEFGMVVTPPPAPKKPEAAKAPVLPPKTEPKRERGRADSRSDSRTDSRSESRTENRGESRDDARFSRVEKREHEKTDDSPRREGRRGRREKPEFADAVAERFESPREEPRQFSRDERKDNRRDERRDDRKDGRKDDRRDEPKDRRDNRQDNRRKERQPEAEQEKARSVVGNIMRDVVADKMTEASGRGRKGRNDRRGGEYPVFDEEVSRQRMRELFPETNAQENLLSEADSTDDVPGGRGGRRSRRGGRGAEQRAAAEFTARVEADFYADEDIPEGNFWLDDAPAFDERKDDRSGKRKKRKKDKKSGEKQMNFKETPTAEENAAVSGDQQSRKKRRNKKTLDGDVFPLGRDDFRGRPGKDPYLDLAMDDDDWDDDDMEFDAEEDDFSPAPAKKSRNSRRGGKSAADANAPAGRKRHEWKEAAYDDVSDEDDEDVWGEDEDDFDDDSQYAPPKPGKKRNRRGRGGANKPREEFYDDDQDDDDEFFGELDDDRGDDDDDGYEEAYEEEPLPPQQRNVPTWQDTVNVIVDKNIKSRSGSGGGNKGRKRWK